MSQPELSEPEAPSGCHLWPRHSLDDRLKDRSLAEGPLAVRQLSISLQSKSDSPLRRA